MRGLPADGTNNPRHTQAKQGVFSFAKNKKSWAILGARSK